MTEPAATIAITGASGLVGTALCETLEGSGASLRVLRISRRRGPNTVVWSPKRGELDVSALDGVDAVVNLAGERIGPGRWTEERKRRIRESRVEGTRLLVKAFAELPQPPKVLVQASAVGYYGNTGDRWVDEDSPRGEGFLAGVVEDWEAASTPAEAMGLRVVRLRFGHVLGKGGLLDALRTPTLLGLGGRLGSGKQFWSFIGIVDLVSIILEALGDSELRGVVNAVTPDPVRNHDFAQRFAHSLHRPAWLPAPKLGLRLVFGREQAQEMLLWGQRVRPGVLLERGFDYAWPRLDDAFAAINAGRIELPRAKAAKLAIAG